jgi:hypothetical protein
LVWFGLVWYTSGGLASKFNINTHLQLRKHIVNYIRTNLDKKVPSFDTMTFRDAITSTANDFKSITRIQYVRNYLNQAEQDTEWADEIVSTVAFILVAFVDHSDFQLIYTDTCCRSASIEFQFTNHQYDP